MMETIEAKIRNHLSPILTLVDFVEEYKAKPEDMSKLIDKMDILKSVKDEIDWFINLGSEVDKMLEDNK